MLRIIRFWPVPLAFLLVESAWSIDLSPGFKSCVTIEVTAMENVTEVEKSRGYDQSFRGTITELSEKRPFSVRFLSNSQTLQLTPGKTVKGIPRHVRSDTNYWTTATYEINPLSEAECERHIQGTARFSVGGGKQGESSSYELDVTGNFRKSGRTTIGGSGGKAVSDN